MIADQLKKKTPCKVTSKSYRAITSFGQGTVLVEWKLGLKQKLLIYKIVSDLHLQKNVYSVVIFSSWHTFDIYDRH